METTSQEKLLIIVTKILSDLKIDYFITGGFAVSVWGRPRATFDIDIIVKIDEPQAVILAKALKEISKAGYAAENMMKNAIRNKGEFNFIDSNSGLKIDFWVAKEDLSLPQEFKNKKLKRINGQDVYFVSPEDLILSKLQWYKISPMSKHLEDIESVFKFSGDKLDMNYIEKWAKALGVSETLDKLKKS